MKIAIFIECAGNEFFQKEADYIIDSYNRTISRYGLDMEVFTYKNCDEGDMRIEDHTILIPGDMRDGWADRIYTVLNYIQEHVDCKWVVKTNTSTLLNLVTLDRFAENRAPVWYHCVDIKFWCDAFTLNILTGKFWMFPKGFIPIITKDFYNMLPDIDYWWNDNWGSDRSHRAPDDAIISYIATIKNVPSEIIPQHMIVDIYNEWFSGLNNLSPGDMQSAMVYVLRMHVSDDIALEMGIRDKFELKTMLFMTRLVEDFQSLN